MRIDHNAHAYRDGVTIRAMERFPGGGLSEGWTLDESDATLGDPVDLAAADSELDRLGYVRIADWLDLHDEGGRITVWAAAVRKRGKRASLR